MSTSKSSSLSRGGGHNASLSSMELGLQSKETVISSTTATTRADLSTGGTVAATAAAAARAVAITCLLLLGIGGAALLVWWALAFHQSNEQLWMVPVSLVLLGTPVITWLSLFASAASR